MSSVGIMLSLALMASAVSAQTPPTQPRDDLDVTMRVIVDPNAKVPDEIVHRISLPKPAQPASGTAPQSDNPDKSDKSDKSGKPTEPVQRARTTLRMLSSRAASLVSRLRKRRGSTPKTLARTKRTSPTLEAHPTRRRAARPWVPRQSRAIEAPRYAAIVFLLGLTICVGTRALAASPDAQARFDEARVAFEAQDFSTALTLYEQALALGLDGPAVHYNIGVAAYRSGALDRAERAFLEVARTPAMAALAHYNLGLVELKRGKPEAARGYFERAAHDGGDERIAGLAAQRLDELPPAPPPIAWSLYARAGAGFDDNVALRSKLADSSGSGEDDAFGELLLSASSSFARDWRVDAAAALLNYGDLDEFDQGAFSLGGARGFAPGGWYLEPGLYANYLTLGGEVYEQSATASARATRTFSGAGTPRAQRTPPPRWMVRATFPAFPARAPILD